MLYSQYNTPEQNAQAKIIMDLVKNEILPKLKAQRKQVKGTKYLYCEGLHGYNWAALYLNQKKTPDRICKLKPLIDVIGESIYEYIKLTKESADTIEFKFITRKELDLKIPGLNEYVWAVNVPGEFWRKYNLN